MPSQKGVGALLVTVVPSPKYDGFVNPKKPIK